MKGEPDSVSQLRRDQFRSLEYRAFALQLFGKGQLDERFQYWQWLYLDNPAVQDSTLLPVFVYYDTDGNAAGQMGAAPFTLSTPSGPLIDAAWCIDFHVLPRYQRKGLGGRLLSAGERAYSFFASLGQTDLAYNLFLKSGWTQGPSLTTCQSVAIRPRSLFRMAARKLGLHSTLREPSYDSHASTSSNNADLILARHPSDRAWNFSYAQAIGRAGVIRSTSYLKWRYARHPLINYELAQVCASRQSDAHAVYHVIERAGLRELHLADLLTEPSASNGFIELKSCMDDIHRLAQDLMCDLVRWDTTVPELIDLRPSRHLYRRGQGARFLYRAAPETGFVPPAAWHLVGGDCDLDALTWNS